MKSKWEKDLFSGWDNPTIFCLTTWLPCVTQCLISMKANMPVYGTVLCILTVLSYLLFGCSFLKVFIHTTMHNHGSDDQLNSEMRPDFDYQDFPVLQNYQNVTNSYQNESSGTSPEPGIFFTTPSFVQEQRPEPNLTQAENWDYTYDIPRTDEVPDAPHGTAYQIMGVLLFLATIAVYAGRLMLHMSMRRMIREYDGVVGSSFEDCFTVCCCEFCSLCQLYYHTDKYATQKLMSRY